MKKIVLSLLVMMILTACGGSSTVQEEETAGVMPAKVNPRTAIWIPDAILFKTDAPIATNIKVECGLPEKFSSYLKLAADKAGVPVFRASKGADINKDRLVVRIVDAVSSGNAFIGHRKYARAEGTLYKNGKKVASFAASRVSGGGFWGGFKGSCSVLDRVVRVMARDISLWLKHPVNDARLGDAIR